MDKNIRIAQYLDQRMISPVEENFMVIDGKHTQQAKMVRDFIG